jgi:hypothetical protein
MNLSILFIYFNYKKLIFITIGWCIRYNNKPIQYISIYINISIYQYINIYTNINQYKMTLTFEEEGTFGWHPYPSNTPMIREAYIAISKTSGAWEFMRTYFPDLEDGFMFSHNPMLENINSNMSNYDSHSGSSYAFVMRIMKFIATKGWDSWVQDVKQIYIKNLEEKITFCYQETERESLCNTLTDFIKKNTIKCKY